MYCRNQLFLAWVMFILCQIVPLPVKSEEADSLKRHRLSHQLEFNLREGYLLNTHPFFGGENKFNEPMRSAGSVHLKYAFRFDPRSRWGSQYPDVYQGIGLACHTFRNREEIGVPWSAYVFQGAPIARLAPSLTLDYEWNFGVSWGWKKYDPQLNPRNMVVGSKMNAYINLGWLLNWQINNDWHLTAGVDVTHFSNGNTHYPNAGVNTVGGRVSLIRTFGTHSYRTSVESRRKARAEIERYFSYDVVLYGATRRKGIIWPDDRVLVPGAFGVAGININPMYNLNACFRAGISLDAQYDESANIKDHVVGDDRSAENIRFYRPPFREQFGVGLSLRAELVMPIFSINLGVGHNVFYQGEDLKGFYQIAALKTSITRRLFLHVGYQLRNFKDPNNLMLGLGYRFNGR